MHFRFLIYKICLPFLKVYNLFIRHQYVPNNDRNIEMYNYLWKIIEDPTYQPSTPIENYTENRLYQSYASTKTDLAANGIDIGNYEGIRQQAAAVLAGVMEGFLWIDDTKWNVQNFATPFK